MDARNVVLGVMGTLHTPTKSGRTPGFNRFDRIPLRRPGKAEDLDGAVVFLASDASSYVTGQTLLVDGGISTGATRAMPRPAP